MRLNAAFAMATLVGLMAICPTASRAQVAGPAAKGGCVSVAASPTMLTATGTLSQVVFPGPPNYESVARGDRPEPTFVLRLPAPVCLDDGGFFADPTKRFDLVQISPKDPGVAKRLKAALGKSVTVAGEGIAAQTAHHHEPLVIFATSASDH